MTQNAKVYDIALDEFGILGVGAVSVVNQPAIESNFVALSNTIKLSATPKRGIIVGAALIPDMLIAREDPDTKELFYIRYSKEVIEQIAHRWLMQNNNSETTLEHGKTSQGVQFVESWVKEFDQDKSVGFGLNNPVGTWYVIGKVLDPTIQEAIDNGTYKGFSIEGNFLFNEAEQEIEQKILKEIETLLSSSSL